MRELTPLADATPGPLARVVDGGFQAALWLTLALAPTVFACLHRFATFDLLLVVCVLLAFWALASLQGAPLVHVRSTFNVAVWALLALVLLQVVPVPRVGTVGLGDGALGRSAAAVLVDGLAGRPRLRTADLPVGRYSLRPAATVGVFLLMASAAGLYWLLGSALIVRRRARRASWALLAGLTLLAGWVLASGLRARAAPADGGSGAPVGPVLILGGDGLVPALLAAVPVGAAMVVRLLGWMPRRPVGRRQTGRRWLGRARAVWGALALSMTALAAAALGMSHAPAALLAGCTVLSVLFVLAGCLASGREGGSSRRAVGLALATGLVIVTALALGMHLGPPARAAAGADEALHDLIAAMPADRCLGGAGAGAVSPRALLGTPGWPDGGPRDRDTDGYLALRAEIGWVGLALVLAAVVALGAMLFRAWARVRGPWPRAMIRAGLGVLAANLLYFGYDAAAVTAPNLLALAAVFGVVTAGSAQGAAWRPDRARDLREAHWPMVLGAVTLIAALGLAESDMLAGAAGPRLSDKVVHFGTFAVVALLLCYALGPQPTARLLKTRILAAVVATTGMGIAIEYAQHFLTGGRSFERGDIVADAAGAAVVGGLWWVIRRAQVADLAAADPRPSAAG